MSSTLSKQDILDSLDQSPSSKFNFGTTNADLATLRNQIESIRYQVTQFLMQLAHLTPSSESYEQIKNQIVTLQEHMMKCMESYSKLSPLFTLVSAEETGDSEVMKKSPGVPVPAPTQAAVRNPSTVTPSQQTGIPTPASIIQQAQQGRPNEGLNMNFQFSSPYMDLVGGDLNGQML